MFNHLHESQPVSQSPQPTPRDIIEGSSCWLVGDRPLKWKFFWTIRGLVEEDAIYIINEDGLVEYY